MSNKLNFNSLPNDPSSSSPTLLEAGIHTLTIVDAETKKTQNDKQMFVLHCKADGSNYTIYDRYTVFDAQGNPEHFGQYKLKKLLEAVNFVPEEDFTLALLKTVLKGKRFIAELVEEEYNGKPQIQFGFPDTYKPVAQEASLSTPAAVEEDDDL